VGQHPNEAATTADTCSFPKPPEPNLLKQQAYWTQQQQKQQINIHKCSNKNNTT